MPLYEYHCHACGRRVEVLQRVSDAPLRECPQCGGAVTKLISAPALQFKGSGFYLTDYGRSGGQKSGSEGSTEKPATESKPASDSKPAADAKPSAPAAKAAS